MTCRHSPGDPNCGSTARSYSPPEPKTPDSANFFIEEAERVGKHLVLKVRYPNCSRCAYEGNKIMVFLNVTEMQVLKWKKIDPHFRDPKIGRATTAAPSPAARFPASPEGWIDALAYARSKTQ